MDSFGRMHLVGALGIAAWLCEAGRLFFVVMSLGTPVALGLVLFVPMANGLLTAVPLTPGGLGVVESGVTGLLRLELAFETAIADYTGRPHHQLPEHGRVRRRCVYREADRGGTPRLSGPAGETARRPGTQLRNLLSP